MVELISEDTLRLDIANDGVISFDIVDIEKIESKSYVPLSVHNILIGDRLIVQGTSDGSEIHLNRIINMTWNGVRATTTDEIVDISTSTATTTATSTETASENLFDIALVASTSTIDISTSTDIFVSTTTDEVSTTTLEIATSTTTLDISTTTDDMSFDISTTTDENIDVVIDTNTDLEIEPDFATTTEDTTDTP